MDYYKSESYIIEGNGTHGVERQIWQPGWHEQFAVTVPKSAPGAPRATERTIYDTEEQALRVWDRRHGRRVGDDREIRCGDVLRETADGAPVRRLCGGCSHVDCYNDVGCGDWLEDLR